MTNPELSNSHKQQSSPFSILETVPTPPDLEKHNFGTSDSQAEIDAILVADNQRKCAELVAAGILTTEEYYHQASQLEASPSEPAFRLFTKNNVVIPDPKANPAAFDECIDDIAIWQSDRLKLQEASIDSQYEATCQLSERLRHNEQERGVAATIYALRGISGAGKTSACRKGYIPGVINPDTGKPDGLISADTSKNDLQKVDHPKTDQIHKESASMNRRLKRKILDAACHAPNGFSEVRDAILKDDDDIQELIKDARGDEAVGLLERRIEMLDVDVPPIVSLVRLAMREKGGTDPIPNWPWWKTAINKVRANRLPAISSLADSGLDVNYTLLAYDYQHQPKDVQREIGRFVKNTNGKYEFALAEGCEELYREATSDIPEEELERLGNQVVNHEFIAWYCDTFFDDTLENQPYIQEVKDKLSRFADRDEEVTLSKILIEGNA